MIELQIIQPGSKWYVGWPYSRVGNHYVLPTAEHERLLTWWREGRGSS